MAGWLGKRMNGWRDRWTTSAISDDKSAHYLIEILLNLVSHFSLADVQDFLFVFACQQLTRPGVKF